MTIDPAAILALISDLATRISEQEAQIAALRAVVALRDDEPDEPAEPDA